MSHKVVGVVSVLTPGRVFESADDLDRFSLVSASRAPGFALDLEPGSWYNSRMELGDRNLSFAANREFSTDGF